jgi:small subunit ribosomal protein S8e|tara:strand:+ start:300 stop:668 length:369 start_codon:yes stop_codon:yes gene_type:complete
MAYGRKISGGKYHKQKKKTKDNLPGIERKVKLRTEKQKTLRTMGGNKKNVLLSTQEANIINPETKKATKTKIKNVLETPSNRFSARQNLLLKSAIIETELGKARITNRPSQEGMVQAVLIKE